MNSIIYSMTDFCDNADLLTDAVLVVAIDREERSRYAINQFEMMSSLGNNAIVFPYDDISKLGEAMHTVGRITKSDDIKIVQGFTNSQYEFVSQLKTCEMLINAKKIVIDISCMLTPHLFLLLKCIYMWNKTATIIAINTIPFDYSFSNTPFTSYKSYYGNLKMEEVFGFSGSKGIHMDKDLFIFAGFEGALALKVIEDIDYNNLYFVNALPSYHQKYKDISVINNYQMIVSYRCKRLFTPAVNPFETYNLLDRYIDKDKGVSIAPLCTKPIALGICMFAIDHDNVRIVYPFSDRYESEKSHDVYKSYVYKVR